MQATRAYRPLPKDERRSCLESIKGALQMRNEEVSDAARDYVLSVRKDEQSLRDFDLLVFEDEKSLDKSISEEERRAYIRDKTEVQAIAAQFLPALGQTI